MNYTAKISTKNPVAISILVDQSGSMSEHIAWNGNKTTKAQAVSEVINNLLTEFVSRARSEESYRHYFDIMVIGYSGKGVTSLLEVHDSYFLSPAQLAGSVRHTTPISRKRTLPDGRSIITNTNQRIWIDAVADGRTPMREAFTKAHQQLKRWCAKHPTSFPPIVINITDGEATDASADQLRNTAEELKSLHTDDGNILLMNVHLSRLSEQPVLFPTSIDQLPNDRYASLLFEISSQMPDLFLQEIALQHNIETANENFYAMAYNASISDLVRMLNIGSTTINHNVTL